MSPESTFVTGSSRRASRVQVSRRRSASAGSAILVAAALVSLGWSPPTAGAGIADDISGPIDPNAAPITPTNDAPVVPDVPVAPVVPVTDLDGGVGAVGPGGSTPAAIPAAQVFATCAVVRNGVANVWFGYESIAPFSFDVPVGVSNVVAVDGIGLASAGQVDQFQPGRTERAFVVSVPEGSTVTWSVGVGDLVSESNPPVAVSAAGSSTSGLPACAKGTPVRSAVVQLAGPADSISQHVVYERRNRRGLLVRADVEYRVTGVVSACSAGGTPMTPKVVFGYGGPTDQFAGVILAGTGAPFAPLTAGAVIRAETTPSGVMIQWSRRSTRRVVDPQRLEVYARTVAESTYFPASFGSSSELVVAEVTGRCRFGGRVVTGETVRWVDDGGRFFGFTTVTDPATQTTVAPDVCNRDWLTPLDPSPGCDIPFIGVGPGTPRFR